MNYSEYFDESGDLIRPVVDLCLNDRLSIPFWNWLTDQVLSNVFLPDSDAVMLWHIQNYFNAEPKSFVDYVKDLYND